MTCLVEQGFMIDGTIWLTVGFTLTAYSFYLVEENQGIDYEERLPTQPLFTGEKTGATPAPLVS